MIRYRDRVDDSTVFLRHEDRERAPTASVQVMRRKYGLNELSPQLTLCPERVHLGRLSLASR